MHYIDFDCILTTLSFKNTFFVIPQFWSGGGELKNNKKLCF